MDFEAYKKELNRELDRIVELLQVTLPRYAELIKKENISNLELSELGEIEYYLIELNGKIADLKKQLEFDLFGLSLDTYYKLKTKANNGNVDAAKKAEMMRKAFNKSLKENQFIIWN